MWHFEISQNVTNCHTLLNPCYKTTCTCKVTPFWISLRTPVRLVLFSSCDHFFGKLKSFVTIQWFDVNLNTSFWRTWWLEHVKKTPQKNGNALSGALLKSCLNLSRVAPQHWAPGAAHVLLREGSSQYLDGPIVLSITLHASWDGPV